MAYLSGFSNRVMLTIHSSGVGATLTNFPVLINVCATSGLTSTDLTQLFTDLVSDANIHKIAVTLSDGTTQCYTEIDYYDFTAQTMILHACVPSVSDSVDTVLYLYWDATAADNTTYVGVPRSTAAKEVWDANFEYVLHMNHYGPSPDSSKYDNSVLAAGGWASGDIQEVYPGMGIDFDRGGDRLYDFGGTYDFLNKTEFTLEAFFNLDQVRSSGFDTLMLNWNNAGYYGHALDIQNTYVRGIASLNGGAASALSTNPVVAGTSYYAAASWSQNNPMNCWLDADKTVGSTQTGVLWRSRENWNFAAANDCNVTGRDIDGRISEIRVSRNQRSDEWIAATNLTLHDTFLTAGAYTPPVIFKDLYFPDENPIEADKDMFYNVHGGDSWYDVMQYFDSDTAWDILNEWQKSTAWDIINAFDRDTAWDILNEFSVNCAWDLLNEWSNDTSWHIHPRYIVFLAEFYLKSICSTFNLAPPYVEPISSFNLKSIQSSFSMLPVQYNFEIKTVFNNVREA